jgi:hypothetical protein
MAPTPDQIKLIRDFEPILFFHGGDANVPAERFFPSDAKRYLEHCALWKARDPFLTRADWGTPLVEAGKLGAIDGEAPVFLGKKTPVGVFEFLETPSDQESFLDLAGWKPTGTPFPPADCYADLDRLAELYQTDTDLRDSQFWYHAEFFDPSRLRLLFDVARNQGGPDFMQLFAPRLSEPAFLTDPALICYYLFFPGHEEGLAGCQGIPEAMNFGSFAGEWACVAVLFNRPLSGGPYSPTHVGLTQRNVGIIKFRDTEIRSGMRIFPWSAMHPYATHPRFVVASGSHGLYLPGEVPKTVAPLTQVDSSAGSCGLAELPIWTAEPAFGIPPAQLFTILAPGKVAAGAASGSMLGPLGTMWGALAGFIWAIAETVEQSDRPDTLFSPSLSPTVDFVSTAGKIVHPVGMLPPEADENRAVEWKSKDAHQVEGRRYDSTVDGTAQIIWPGDGGPDIKGFN